MQPVEGGCPSAASTAGESGRDDSAVLECRDPPSGEASALLVGLDGGEDVKGYGEGSAAFLAAYLRTGTCSHTIEERRQFELQWLAGMDVELAHDELWSGVVEFGGQEACC